MIRFRAVRAIWGSPEDMEGQWFDHMVDVDGKTPEELLGYELMAGLSIFYVKTDVFQQGLREKLIEPLGDEPPKLRFEEVWAGFGIERCETLRQAMLDATAELLATTLSQVPHMEDTIRVRVYDAFHQRNVERETGREHAPYLMEELLLDPVTAQVLEIRTPTKEQCLKQCYFCSFHQGMGYVECVERLAQRAYRHYLNVEDLFGIYEENDFYDVDRFLQRLLRLEFEFIKGESDKKE